MIAVTDNQFDKELKLTRRVPGWYFTDNSVKYFDNDGFELTEIELLYYEMHGINVQKGILNHSCDQREWIIMDQGKLMIDHSMILQRWEFAGDAYEQIKSHTDKLPRAVKLLNIVPKWGLDFALDCYDNNAFEVIHIEVDYRSYEQAQSAKIHLEKQILDTDWNDFAKQIYNKREEWAGLTGFAQNDWKAVYWGLRKAEVTEKSFNI